MAAGFPVPFARAHRTGASPRGAPAIATASSSSGHGGRDVGSASARLAPSQLLFLPPEPAPRPDSRGSYRCRTALRRPPAAPRRRHGRHRTPPGAALGFSVSRLRLHPWRKKGVGGRRYRLPHPGRRSGWRRRCAWQYRASFSFSFPFSRSPLNLTRQIPSPPSPPAPIPP